MQETGWGDGNMWVAEKAVNDFCIFDGLAKRAHFEGWQKTNSHPRRLKNYKT